MRNLSFFEELESPKFDSAFWDAFSGSRVTTQEGAPLPLKPADAGRFTPILSHDVDSKAVFIKMANPYALSLARRGEDLERFGLEYFRQRAIELGCDGLVLMGGEDPNRPGKSVDVFIPFAAGQVISFNSPPLPEVVASRGTRRVPSFS